MERTVEQKAEEHNKILLQINMGEPEAYKALEEGYIRVDGKVYNMEKQPQGWCDGCCFYNMEICPSIAKKVCCTGGVIFHERK